MAQTTVMQVAVKQLSKYGFQLPNGNYMGLSKQFKDQAKLVPGAIFEAEVYIADSGKEYLNKIISQSSMAHIPNVSKVVTETPKADAERTKKFTPKFTKKDDSGMSKDEWAAKDQRISRQGVIQAAVIALAPTMATEGLFEAAEALANQMLGFVNPK